jgi:hypothetical protein
VFQQEYTEHEKQDNVMKSTTIHEILSRPLGLWVNTFFVSTYNYIFTISGVEQKWGKFNAVGSTYCDHFEIKQSW